MSLIHYVDMAEGSRGSVGGVDAALNKMFPPRCARARVTASAREGGERAYDAALALVSMGCCSGFALICARVTPQWREAAAVYLRATRCPRPLCRVERRASAPTPSSSTRGRPALTYPPPPPTPSLLPRRPSPSDLSMMQEVDKAPATRFDVEQLQVDLAKALARRKARLSGICPVREDLYSQCFDELIREVMLNNKERGLLLCKIREDVKMTIDAYKILYQSSVTFGTRKHLEAEEGVDEMQARVAELQALQKAKQDEQAQLINKLDLVEKRASERRAIDGKERKEEISFLKYQGDNLERYLKKLST